MRFFVKGLYHISTSSYIRLPKPSRVTEIYGRSPERRNMMSFDEGFRFGETRIYRLGYDQPRTQGKDTE